MIVKLDFYVSSPRKKRPEISYWMVEDRDGNVISLKEAVRRGMLKLLCHDPSGINSNHPSKDVYFFRVLDPEIKLIEIRKTWYKPADLEWPCHYEEVEVVKE